MRFRSVVVLVVLLLAVRDVAAQGQPPFSGTIFIDPDIIGPDDPSAFEGLVPAGQGNRTMFDRRVNNWITVNAFLFDVTFDDGLSVEVQVNPEFGTADSAQAPAERYARVIGQLPTALRRHVETVWIHKGVNPFGGGNNNLLIHTGQAALYEADGILAETLVHEASHTSLDADHAASEGWLAAQRDDPTFISTYARDNPNREDVAESFLPYLAIRYRSDRIDMGLFDTITAAIPNRIAYFDGLELDMYPVAGEATGVGGEVPEVARGVRLDPNYPNPFSQTTVIPFSVERSGRAVITVHDLLGRQVGLLWDGAVSGGKRTVTWDAGGYPSGVYVVRVSVDGEVGMRGLVVRR